MQSDIETILGLIVEFYNCVFFFSVTERAKIHRNFREWTKFEKVVSMGSFEERRKKKSVCSYLFDMRMNFVCSRASFSCLSLFPKFVLKGTVDLINIIHAVLIVCGIFLAIEGSLFANLKDCQIFYGFSGYFATFFSFHCFINCRTAIAGTVIGLLFVCFILLIRFLLRPYDIRTTSNLLLVHSCMQFQVKCVRDVISHP